MSSIDERIVEMQFDNKQFEEGVATTTKTLEKFKENLDFSGAEKGFEDVAKAASGMKLDGLASAIDEINNKFSVMGVIGMTAINNITNKALNYLENTIKGFTVAPITTGWEKYAQKTAAVQTIMAATRNEFEGMGNQMELVEAQLERLNTFTDETSYSFLDMVNNIGKFTSNNVKLETSVKAMQGISTWAAVSGATINEAGRAMYNLSQSLSQGSVKVIDWKSIENANMATAEFKQTAIETAAAMGTLKEVGEGLYETLDGKTTVSIETFRDSLQKAWFSSDVLLKTLDKYGGFANELMATIESTDVTATQWMMLIDSFKDGTIDMREAVRDTGIDSERLTGILSRLSSAEFDLGRRAFRAAQEAKTFREAMDSVSEAVGSGWMNTFETIFGNYEQAKVIWTDLANNLYDVFAEPGNRRNQLLGEWAELGGRDSLLRGIYDMFGGIKKLMDNMSNAFHKIFPPTTPEFLLKITNAFSRAMSQFRRAMEFVEDEIDDWRDRYNEVKEEFNDVIPIEKATEAVNEFAKTVILGQYGNGDKRKNALEDLGLSYGVVQNAVNELLNCNYRYETSEEDLINTARVLMGIEGDKAESMSISASSAESLIKGVVGLTHEYKNYSDEFTRGADASQSFVEALDAQNSIGSKLHDTIKGIVAVVRIITDAVTALKNRIIMPFIKWALPRLVTAILDVTSTIGRALTKFSDFVHEGQIFERVFRGIAAVFVNFGKSIKAVIDRVKELESLKKLGEIFENFFDKLFGKEDDKKFGSIEDFFDSIIDFVSNSKAVDFMVGVIDKLVGAFLALISIVSPVATAMGDIFRGIANGIRTFDWSKLSPITKAFSKVVSAISEGVKILIEYAQRIPFFVNNLSAGVLKAFGLDAYNKLVDKFYAFNKVLKVVKEFFGQIFSNLKSGQSLMNGVVDKFSALGATFEPMTTAMSQFFEPVLKIIRPLGTAIVDVIKRIGGALIGMDLGTILEYIRSGAAIFAILGLGKVFMSVARLVKGVSYVFESVSEAITAFKRKLQADTLFTLALAVSAMAGAVYLLSKIPEKDLKAAGNAMLKIGAVLVGLIAVTFILSKLDGGGKGMMTAAFTVVALAGAMMIMVNSIAQLTKLTSKEYETGLTRVVILLGILGIIAVLIGGFAQSMSKDKVWGTIVAVAAVYVLALSVQKVVDALIALCNEDLTQLNDRLPVLLKIMFTMTTIAWVAGHTKMGGGFNMLATVASLWLFIKLLEKLEGFDFKKIERTIGEMTPIFEALLGLAVVARIGGKGFAGIGTMLIGLGVSILLLGKAIEMIGELSLPTIIKGGVVVGALIYALSLFVTSIGILGQSVSVKAAVVLIAVATAIAILAGVIIVLSILPWHKALIGALVAGSLIVTLGKFMEGVGKMDVKSALPIMIGLVVLVGVISAAIWALSILPAEGVLAAATAIGGVIFAISYVLKAISKDLSIADVAAATIAMLAMSGLIFVIGLIVSGLTNMIGDRAGEAFVIAVSVGLLFAELVAVMVILAKSNVNPAQAATAALDVVTFIGIIATVMAALAEVMALIVDPEMLLSGLDMIVTIFYKLGEAVGSIVGGALAGLTNGFEQIGENLAKFSEAVGPFMEFLKGVDDTAAGKIGIVTDLITQLVSLNINSWGYNAATVKTQLDNLGTGILSLYTSLKDVKNWYVIAQGVTQIKKLAEIKFPTKTPQWASWLVGIDDFAAYLTSFGKKLTETGFNMESVISIGLATLSASKLADLAKKVNGIGTGGLSSFFGDKDVWSKLGDGLVEFADTMVKFGAHIAIATPKQLDGFDKAVTMTEKLVELQNALPPSNDFETLKSVFVGQREEWTGLTDGLDPYVTALRKFCAACATSFTDHYIEAFDKGVLATQKLAELQTALPTSNGLIDYVVGKKESFLTFGEGLAQYAEALKSFGESAEGLNVEAGDSVIDFSNRLAGFVALDPDLSKLYTFGSDLVVFGGHIQQFYESIGGQNSTTLEDLAGKIVLMVSSLTNGLQSSGATEAVQLASANIVDTFITSVSNRTEEISAIGTSMAQNICLAIQEYGILSQFYGGLLAADIIEGIIRKTVDARHAGEALAIAASNGANSDDRIAAFKSAGRNAALGYIEGVRSKINDGGVWGAGYALGQAALEAARKALQEASPSKAMRKVGLFAGEGLVLGLEDSITPVSNSGYSLGEMAVEGLRSAVEAAYDMINNEIDADPVITPILDLSNITAGARRLDNLIRQNPSIGANVYESAENNQNGENASANGGMTFIQNNYSPKALSRAELYRQTRNQFAQAKGLVEA